MVRYALVTGGAGFIGSNLVERLVESGYHIVVIDNLSTGSLNNITIPLKKIRVINGHCSTIDTLELPDPEIIYHMGVPSSSPMYKEDPELVGETITTFIRVLEKSQKRFSPN